MSEIDASVLKRTQDSLGKYVKKPVLTEKLLKKPPFRFLHDVFKAVIKDTGCFATLYTTDELNYENISDRDAKMKFLQKMIDTIKMITSEPLTVKASKIVAGHEPEKTNELLQLIGTVIEKKLDWKSAVETVQNGGSPSNPKQKLKDKELKENKSKDRSPKVAATKKLDTPKEKAKTEVKEKIKSKEIKDKSLRKPSKVSDTEKKEEKKLKSKSSSKEPLKKTSTKKVSGEVISKAEPKPKVEIQPTAENIEKQKDIVETVTTVIRDENKAVTPPEIPSPSKEFNKEERRANKRAEEILLATAVEDANAGNESRRSSGSKRSSGRSHRSSAEKSRKSKPEEASEQMPADTVDSLKTVTEEQPSDTIVSPSLKSQPSSTSIPSSDVKRESTFVREDSKETAPIPSRPRTSLRPPSARPASARPGAPRRRDKNIEIILQPNDQIKLSGISVKLETFNSELEDDGENLVIIENANTEDQLQESINKDKDSGEDDSQQQGHLVQQILETQKELVQGSSPDTEQKKDKDITNLNSRQSSARQMNSLRDVIQNLTKSVNPLGKLMDFIPEDIDAMQLELTMWRDTYNQSSLELKKERSLTESVTEPMKNQLVTIEANIKEYREMIDACRTKILLNSEKIQRLLTTQ